MPVEDRERGTGRGLRLKQRIVGALDIPPEIMPELPYITLFGNQRLTLVNHQGVAGFSSSSVAVRTALGLLVVAGEGLVLRLIAPEEIIVDGTITSLRYED